MLPEVNYNEIYDLKIKLTLLIGKTVLVLREL